MAITKVAKLPEERHERPKDEWRLPPFNPERLPHHSMVLCHCPVRDQWYHEWDGFLTHMHPIERGKSGA